MNIEVINTYNDNFELIGRCDYDTVHKTGLWHQVIHCWIIERTTRSIVYQKRSENKSIYPNLLDVSVAGHCREFETPEVALEREAFEELGLAIDTNKLNKIGIRRDSFAVGDRINREFQHIFFYETELTANGVTIDNNELQYIVLVKPDDVIKSLKEQTSVEAIKLINNTLSQTMISYKEFIPSLDNYNVKIPLAISKYLIGERQFYF